LQDAELPKPELLDRLGKVASHFDLRLNSRWGKRRHDLKLVRVLTLFGFALPAFAQYAGPAILSRGEAPAAMSAPEIKFRPFVEFAAGYETGLAGVAVSDSQGKLPDASSGDLSLVWGVSGSHNWKHTKLGLDYRGSLSHYLSQGSFDSLSQAFLMGITQQITRHISLSLRESAGLFTRAFGQGSLSQTVAFDPSQSYIPTTDFFDNRTYYFSTQVDAKIQKTARLSFALGANSLLTRYRAKGLVGTNGYGAHGDVQYRLDRRSTIGAGYNYQHFSFGGQFGNSDVHSVAGSYSRALTGKLEFSASLGASRIEQKSILEVAVDPVIAALLGVSTTAEIAHFVTWTPSGSMRLSQGFRQGVAYVSASRGVLPGNGLFITSYTDSVSVGYTYTGVRRWSLNSFASYDRSQSVGNFIGNYSDVSGGISASRQIVRTVHMVFGFNVRKYQSPGFQNYNRTVEEGHFGIGYTPGDVPLRIW
jgi:hypothetical protein